ncbi:MAG TPA: peptidase M61 [Novosphingobium sp.]|nr:peptidase M61 [Novosphingobium sp.]
MASASTPAMAQPRSAPAAAVPAPALPAAQDKPWPAAPITLAVDATDTERGLFRTTETIALPAGTTRITLVLPRWTPGDHKPSLGLGQLADLHFTAHGEELRWQRDPVEFAAFHVEVPAGTSELVASFVHTSPLQASEGQILMTPDMLNLEWWHMALYPAGYFVRQIPIRPSVKLPAGWQAASALDGATRAGDTITYGLTDFETLVDSPVFAGSHARRLDLGEGIALNLFADKPDQLEISASHIAAYKALASEAVSLFGARHFDHYDLLLGLSDKLGAVGLEHHRSSENTMLPRALVDWAEMDWDRNVIPHELTHSWNGKFRRPADLWTPDYTTPMQDSLLWVYEGQTQFWGHVLAARAGVQSKDVVLGMIASNAGQFTQWPGRGWRAVADTTNDPLITGRRPLPFGSIERGEEYYTEGMLMWLEVDQTLRQGTHGARGLDDFARAFFGVRDGDWGDLTYTRADVVATLNTIMPYDWAGFLTARIDQPGRPAPLAGIEMGGYRLVWKDEPNPFDKGRAAQSHMLGLGNALGITLDKDGRVVGTLWGSPAFTAGIVTGAKVIAVNGTAYEAEALKKAITAAKGSDKPIELTVQRGDKVQTIAIPYHDGLRWPWLERAAPGKAPTGLDQLLAPRRKGA